MSGDIVMTTNLNPKEGGGSSSIKCPMLNSTNYTVWAIRMEIALKVHKIWEAIKDEATEGEKNNMEMALLLQSIPEVLILQSASLVPRRRYGRRLKPDTSELRESKKRGCKH